MDEHLRAKHGWGYREGCLTRFGGEGDVACEGVGGLPEKCCQVRVKEDGDR